MRTFGYVRVSTAHQLELSPEQQRQEILLYCERNALPQPTRIFADEGVSGMKVERKEYQEMLATVSQGDVVITYDLSRLGRRAKELISALDFFRENQIRYISIRQGLDSSTIAGSLVYGILAVVNEMLVHEARERTQASIDYLKANGFKTGGCVPFGFDALPTDAGIKLVANRAEYDVIVLVNSLRASGSSLRSIAKVLQDRGVKTKQGCDVWHASTVRALLTRGDDAGVLLARKDNDF